MKMKLFSAVLCMALSVLAVNARAQVGVPPAPSSDNNVVVDDGGNLKMAPPPKAQKGAPQFGQMPPQAAIPTAVQTDSTGVPVPNQDGQMPAGMPAPAYGAMPADAVKDLPAGAVPPGEMAPSGPGPSTGVPAGGMPTAATPPGEIPSGQIPSIPAPPKPPSY